MLTFTTRYLVLSANFKQRNAKHNNRVQKGNYQCLTLTVYALFSSQLNRKTKKTFKTDEGHTNSRTAQEAK